MRWRWRSRVSFPRLRKRRPPPLEDDVDVDAAEKDAVDSRRSTDRDFERSRWRWKHGSLDVGVAGTVGEDGAGVGGTRDVGFGAARMRRRASGANPARVRNQILSDATQTPIRGKGFKGMKGGVASTEEEHSEEMMSLPPTHKLLKLSMDPAALCLNFSETNHTSATEPAA
ncbi:hypothetical protein C8R44DRAFT_729028 [Mycena epipterygia]|nr:hypothetical protein C8R44DRAFT_729028 [Mycena epipterygia]